jgi:Sulfotransferase family
MTVTSADALAERAMAATALSDFGASGWQVGLAHLLEAAEADLGDDAAAIRTVENIVSGRLESRLGVEAWYAEQYDDRLAQVEGPLVIVGLPRTATTALHYLLAVDPQFRYPRRWEMTVPVPPPDPETEQDDPRRVAAASRGGDVRHISSIDGPTEDGFIHALHFGSQELALPVSTYHTWWRQTNLSGTFAYQERVLRLLHSSRPPHHWLLKTPAYLFHLPEMGQQYPEARFVMTHRDPVAALPSTCSVVLDARKRVLPGFEQSSSLGEELVAYFAQGVQQAIDARTEVGEHRFIDVDQDQVEKDPVGTAERIYQFAGLDLCDDVKVKMRDWAAANRRGSRGAHLYTAEEFGLTTDGIRDAFASYRRQFAAYMSEA